MQRKVSEMGDRKELFRESLSRKVNRGKVMWIMAWDFSIGNSDCSVEIVYR